LLFLCASGCAQLDSAAGGVVDALARPDTDSGKRGGGVVHHSFCQQGVRFLPDLEQTKAIAQQPAAPASVAVPVGEKPRLSDRVAERKTLPL